MDKHAADIARLCDQAGIGKAVFAGISIGGYVLFEFWRRFRDRVHALILCDTRASADNEQGRANRLKSADDVEQRGPISFIDSMIPKLLGESTRRTRPDLVESARKMMLQMSVAGIAAVQRGMAARPDSTATLASIKVPTLIVVGAEDVLTPPGCRSHAAVHRGQPFRSDSARRTLCRLRAARVGWEAHTRVSRSRAAVLVFTYPSHPASLPSRISSP
jgi:3-oxoadipate enol-lactonase